MTLIITSGLLMPLQAQAIPVAKLVQNSGIWLQHRGIPVENPTIVRTVDSFLDEGQDDMVGQEYQVAAYTVPNKIVFGPISNYGIHALARRYEKKTKLDDEELFAAHATLHELLHSVSFDNVWYNDRITDEDRWYEEGIVDQVAADFLPAYTKQMFEYRIIHPVLDSLSYKKAAKQVRVLSVFATNSKNSQAYNARKWRIKLLLADLDTRRQMVYDAHHASMK